MDATVLDMFLTWTDDQPGHSKAVLLSNDLDQKNESRRNARLLHNSFDHFKCKAASAAE